MCEAVDARLSPSRDCRRADHRVLGRSGRVYVLTGDGELQEGQFWESLQPTANRKLAEITVIVDRNLVQSDTWVSEVSDLGDLEAKLRAFGWVVRSCDGHDLRAFADTLAGLDDVERPRAVIANTRKGGGGITVTVSVPDTSVVQLKSGAQTGASVTVPIAAAKFFTCIAIAPESTDSCNRLQIVAEAFTLRKPCDLLRCFRSCSCRRW